MCKNLSYHFSKGMSSTKIFLKGALREKKIFHKIFCIMLNCLEF